MNINDFREHYQGFDVSLSISLFEYGFIYSYTDPRSNGDLRVWFKVNGPDMYNWADFKKDLDFWREFNWIGDSKESFLRCFDLTEEAFNKEPLEFKIRAAIDYFGYENICGTAYYPYTIKERE